MDWGGLMEALAWVVGGVFLIGLVWFMGARRRGPVGPSVPDDTPQEMMQRTEIDDSDAQPPSRPTL